MKKFATWTVLLWVLLLLFPVQTGITRMLTLSGAVLVFLILLHLGWERRRLRLGLLGLGAVCLLLLALPGRTVNQEALRRNYLSALQLHGHARYVWGGENMLGIDCSGLARQGFIVGQFLTGMQTVNGTCLRSAASLWWNDCTARALRDGYRGLTVALASAENVAALQESAELLPGDLAITQDGVHVMIYLGDGAWTAADPEAGRVIRVALPTDNHWFHVPVKALRWSAL